MKKCLALVLGVLLILSLPACGEEKTAEPAPSVAAAGQTQAPPPNALIGTQNGNAYQNTHLGFTCVLPEAFVYSTEKELLQKNGLDAQASAGELEAMLQNGQPVQLMYALDQAGRRNVMVTFQQAPAEELAQKDLKADLQAQLDGDIRAYEAMGITNVTGEYTRLTVGGKTLDGLVLSGENQGQKLVSVTAQYKAADGLVTLTLNGPERHSLEQLLQEMTLA